MSDEKLSVFLGLRDRTEKTNQNMLDDMHGKFKNKQGLFQGIRNTYEPLTGYADEPGKRNFTAVASTVKEQLDWFKEHTKDFYGITFSIEKTNAGGVTAELEVDGVKWGVYTSLELLRLKSILDSKLKAMISEIPIRKETVIWSPTQDANYTGRDIFESPLNKSFAKTTLKETYIVNDPHVKDMPGRAPISAEKSTQVNVGEASTQEFSGEYTNRQRAEIQTRYEKLYKAVIKALETANDKTVERSNLGDKVLDFLF